MFQINSSVKSQFQLQDYPTYLFARFASPRIILSVSVGLDSVDTDLTCGMEKQHQVVSLRFGVLWQCALTFEEPVTAI